MGYVEWFLSNYYTRSKTSSYVCFFMEESIEDKSEEPCKESFIVEMGRDPERGVRLGVPRAVGPCLCRRFSFCFSRIQRLQEEASKQRNQL